MNKFCVGLNIKLTPLKKEISCYKSVSHQRVPLNELHPDLLAFFKQHNLSVLLAEMFYNDPHNVSKIHIDSIGGDYSKINFIWGGGDSVMNWFSINQGAAAGQNLTKIGTKSVLFSPNDVLLAHSQPVHSPSIVQVGVPHNITNGNSPRWCLSIVPIRANGKRLTMEETKTLFKKITFPGA